MPRKRAALPFRPQYLELMERALKEGRVVINVDPSDIMPIIRRMHHEVRQLRAENITRFDELMFKRGPDFIEIKYVNLGLSIKTKYKLVGGLTDFPIGAEDDESAITEAKEIASGFPDMELTLTKDGAPLEAFNVRQAQI